MSASLVYILFALLLALFCGTTSAHSTAPSYSRISRGTGTWGVEHPLSKVEALQYQAKFAKIKAFLEALELWFWDKYLEGCKKASTDFAAQCIGKTEVDCQIFGCSNSGYTAQATCTSSGNTWYAVGNAPDDACCEQGSLRSADSRCDACLNPSHADYATQCVLATYEGSSLCGATQGTCNYCAGQRHLGSQSDCTSRGGSWLVNQTATYESQCKSEDACYTCVGGTGTSKSDCETQGTCQSLRFDASSINDPTACASSEGLWIPAVWTHVPGYTYTDRDSCTDQSNHHWVQWQHWTEGTPLPTAPMTRMTCSGGGQHTADGLADIDGEKRCVNEGKFLQDALSGNSLQTAVENAYEYYHRELPKAMVFKGIVTSHASAYEKAKLTIANTACFMPFLTTKVKGEVLFEGGEQSYLALYNGITYESQHPTTFTGGSVLIVGGTSHATISATSSGNIEIAGLTNWGTLSAANSPNIMIADVVNHGNIVVNDVTATLINVSNSGTVTISAPPSGAKNGKYKAYDLVNTGSILVTAGDIDFELLCPPSGTPGSLTIASAVTGVLTYQKGCQGTVSAGSNVELREITSTTTTTPQLCQFSAPTASQGVASSAGYSKVAGYGCESDGFYVDVVQAFIDCTADSACKGVYDPGCNAAAVGGVFSLCMATPQKCTSADCVHLKR